MRGNCASRIRLLIACHARELLRGRCVANAVAESGRVDSDRYGPSFLSPSSQSPGVEDWERRLLAVADTLWRMIRFTAVDAGLTRSVRTGTAPENVSAGDLAKYVAWAFGAALVVVLLAVALRRQIGFTEESWFIIRVVLALAAGAVAALIPGFLNVTAAHRFAEWCG